VAPKLRIPGDVDLKTGHVKFDGDIDVRGHRPVKGGHRSMYNYGKAGTEARYPRVGLEDGPGGLELMCQNPSRLTSRNSADIMGIQT